MKRFLLVAFLLLIKDSAVCQDLNAVVHDVLMSLQNPQNGITQYSMPDFTIDLVQSEEFNAFADVKARRVHVNSALVRILYRDPGELAFVIAHEIGHIQDSDCALRAGKAGYSGARLLRFCEASADNIGMQYVLAAGYSPFDAAGLMGKLLMADSSQSSVFGIVIGRFLSDHPVDVDRIKELAQDARAACQSRPEICHH